MIVKTTYLLFQNKDFCIYKAKVISGGEDYGENFYPGATISLLGYNLPMARIEVTGKPEKSKRNKGWQLKVQTCAPAPDLSKLELVDYLANLDIPRLGKRTAKKIVNKFDDPLKAMENAEELKKVRGISAKKAEDFARLFKTHNAFATALSLLMPYGFSANACKRVAEKFAENTEAVVKANPYLLCQIRGIGFRAVDVIGRENNIPLDHQDRLKAAIFCVLSENESQGHTVMRLETFEKRTKGLTGNVSNDALARAFNELLQKEGLYKAKWHGETVIAKGFMYQRENSLAKAIARMATRYTFTVRDKEARIKEAAKAKGLTLAPNQIEAAATAMDSSLTVITGGPGTGKTSVLTCLCDAFEDAFPKKKIVLLSPTGKAARRMREQTGRQASTIHSAMQILPDDPPDKEYDLAGDLIIVDEASMLDLLIAEKLFNAVHEGAHVVLVGDVDQLPSVGAGAVLNDVIASKTCPVVRLTEIFRQAKGSAIVEQAYKIKDGDTALKSGVDFKWVKALGAENIAKACEKFYLSHPGDTVCLCPNKKGEAGVHAMNERLQNALNPDGINFHGIRIGDPVMQLVNDPETGISNGDVGVAAYIGNEGDGDYLVVRYFDEVDKAYYKSDMDECMLAYAMTVHKSQGSEYQTVLCPMSLDNGIMLKRNLLYTAVTRGKAMVYLIGEPAAFKKAIETGDANKRKTLLTEKIRLAREQELKIVPFRKGA